MKPIQINQFQKANQDIRHHVQFPLALITYLLNNPNDSDFSDITTLKSDESIDDLYPLFELTHDTRTPKHKLNKHTSMVVNLETTPKTQMIAHIMWKSQNDSGSKSINIPLDTGRYNKTMDRFAIQKQILHDALLLFHPIVNINQEPVIDVPETTFIIRYITGTYQGYGWKYNPRNNTTDAKVFANMKAATTFHNMLPAYNGFIPSQIVELAQDGTIISTTPYK